MNTKAIAAIAVFTALTVALVLSPAKVPAPYAPFLKYQLWEIPLVVAFLLYGPLVGLSVSLINTVVLLGVYPGELPTGPLYNLTAVASMLLGIFITHRLPTGGLGKHARDATLTVSSTVLGIILRVIVMSIVNWIFLRYPYPIGFEMPVEALTAMLPIIGFFNATVTAYTVPTGYFLARAIGYGTKTRGWSQN